MPYLTWLNGSRKGVYLDCVRDPGSCKYNVAMRFDLPHGIEEDRWLAAVKTVLAAHPALHTVLGLQDGAPASMPETRGAVAGLCSLAVGAEAFPPALYETLREETGEADNRFTTNILYCIGFSRPLTDDAYLDRAIRAVMTPDYFGPDTAEDGE